MSAKSNMQYAGLAFQMFFLILMMMFIGQKIDQYFEFQNAVLKIILPLFGLIVFLYKLYLDLSK